MNLQAIFHQPKSNYCFAYDENNTEIRLRTAKGDLSKACLIYGDKYDWDKQEKIQMELACSDSIFDYFTVSIKAPNNRLSYYFALECEEEKFYFTEWGVINEVDEQEIQQQLFHYPYVNEIDIHKVPEWVKDSVFYQIFPERFNNGDKSIDPENVEEWGGVPKTDNFFGGDLRGIIEKLDYLEDLGVNAIYMTPTFVSTTNHKYNTIDYFKIDPHFGDLDTMKELVQKCHAKGIKVVLDAVFNHCGDEFPQFQDVIEKGKDSSYWDWFHVKDFPVTADPLNYETFGFVPSMPKFNTANKEVMDYLLKVAKYWIEECDIDGWRLDVANEIDHNFWREFRKAVKEAKEDAYIVGEIWHESLPWLMGDQFDATMNYPVTRACTEYFAKDNVNAKEFKELISNTIMRNTRQVNEVMLNLLDSHDTARFLTECKGDIKKLMMADGFLLTFLGTTSIYYGTEIGMEGANDPDCRRTMEWNKEKWNMELYNFYKDIIAIRKSHDALKRGCFKWIDDLEDVVGYTRETETEKIIVLINNSSETKEVELKTSTSQCLDLMENEKINVNEGKINIAMHPYSLKIIQ